MNIKKRFIEIWSDNKIFRYAVIIHLGYFIVALILVFTILREQNDFIIFFAAGETFYNDIDSLYDQRQYLWDYRYLPLSAMFFVPFYLLGFELGFILFHILNLILNILICVILYKICVLVKGEDHEEGDKRIILYISFYLMSVTQIFNYLLGQINLYITFFILIALYIFLKYENLKWQFFGSLILGISIIIKPIAISLIPFLFIINLDFKRRRKLMIDVFTSIIRLIGVILPVSLNIFLFLLYPKLWEGFITTNFTGSNPTTLNFSFSITKLILNFCYVYNIPFNQIIIFIVVVSVLGILGFIIFIIGRFGKNFSIIYGLTLGILILLLGYFDSWNHHLLNLTPLLIIIIFNLPRHSKINEKYIKKSFFFLNFFDLGFMWLWFPTTIFLNFPYNFASTIFLIMIFYGISKYGLIIYKKNKETQLKFIS
ncbi:MAG: glycosyltransferase 87 family protein [Promethearchaeota archaeon]